MKYESTDEKKKGAMLECDGVTGFKLACRIAN